MKCPSPRSVFRFINGNLLYIIFKRIEKIVRTLLLRKMTHQWSIENCHLIEYYSKVLLYLSFIVKNLSLRNMRQYLMNVIKWMYEFLLSCCCC